MRAAILLSVMFLICGVAALFGVPAVHVDGQPILGASGFLMALVAAAIPPFVVFAWLKWLPRNDLAAANVAMKIGAVAAALGAGAAIVIALAASRELGPSLSAVVIPLAAATVTLVAAASIYRQSRRAVYVAISAWVLMGLLPSSLPLWLGLLVTVCLIVAARGAFIAHASSSTL